MQHDEVFGLGKEVNDIVKNSSFNHDVYDTALIYDSKAMQSENWWASKRDTVLRFGPVTLFSKKGILLAKVANNHIYRYDLIFDNYSLWKYPLMELRGQKFRDKYEPSNEIWKTFVNRGYSNLNEFEELSAGLTKKYGKPNKLEGGLDTLIAWANDGVSIRLHNSRLTTTISYFQPGGEMIDSRDWQFSSVTPDTFLSNFPLGITKSEVRSKYITFRDTVIKSSNSTESFGVAKLSAWGIPGELTLIFDQTSQKLKRVVWEAQGTGNPLFEGVFMICGLELDKVLPNSLSEHREKIQPDKKMLSWSNDIEGLALIYYDPKSFLFVKSDIDFLLKLEE